MFGKLPAHGDFVCRGVDGQVERLLDSWLSQWIAAERSRLGTEFEDVYRSAQPWLYCDNASTAVLIPSADRAGRLFPLFVATNKPVVVQRLYDLAVDAIGRGMPADSLYENVGMLDGHSFEETLAGVWFLPDKDHPSLADPGDFVPAEAGL